jgi:hypothetical protein
MPDSKPGLRDSCQLCAINEPPSICSAVAFRNAKIHVVLSQLNITDFKSLLQDANIYYIINLTKAYTIR